MKLLRSLVLPAALALAAACSAPAQVLTGAWTLGDTTQGTTSSGVAVFIGGSNTFYYLENTSDPSGNDGFERGTYSWDGINGHAFTLTVDNDKNGNIGFSTLNISTATLTLTGGTSFVFNDPDGLGSGSTDPFTKVTGSGSLIGAWYLGNPHTLGTTNNSGVAVFTQTGFNGTVYSGNFFIARDLPVGDPDGGDEIEHGTYTWNPTSGAFAFGPTFVDLNPTVGLLSSPTITNFMVSGTTLTGFDGSSFTLTSVSAVPEPSTYAALAGVAALGLAVWRRRRTAAVV